MRGRNEFRWGSGADAGRGTRRTGPRPLRHHLRLHRLLPHLLERRGVPSRALLSDTKQRLDGGLVPGRGQLARLLGIPLKRDRVTLALQILRETHALRMRVCVHDDFAEGGGARSGREPARAAIVPLVVVAQRDLDGRLLDGLVKVLFVFLEDLVDAGVGNRLPEHISRDVLLGHLERVRSFRVERQPHPGAADGVVDEAKRAHADLRSTRAAVGERNAELLQRRPHVQVLRIREPDALFFEGEPVEVARVVPHRTQVRRREQGHRAWARQI